jgi:hypothetical protein
VPRNGQNGWQHEGQAQPFSNEDAALYDRDPFVLVESAHVNGEA